LVEPRDLPQRQMIQNRPHHLTGLIGSTVKVTMEIEAQIPSGAPDQVVRIATENCRTLKFTSQGFEAE
jgi:hypothetical protein